MAFENCFEVEVKFRFDLKRVGVILIVEKFILIIRLSSIMSWGFK